MANENDYTPEGTGTNGLVQEGDDLKSSSKDTLGSYLSSVTAKNSYPVEDTERIETSLRGTGDLPAEFTTGGQDGTPGFTSTFPTGGTSSEAAVSNFETLSDSGKIERLGDILNKNSRTDGSSLIRQIVSNREPGEPGRADARADPGAAAGRERGGLPDLGEGGPGHRAGLRAGELRGGGHRAGDRGAAVGPGAPGRGG